MSVNVEPGEEFLGRADERKRWLSVLDESHHVSLDDPRSFVTVVHGIGGMGKTQLTRRLVQIADGSVEPEEQAFHSPVACVSIDLEAERQRLPERYPAIEGPSVGTLLYTLERAVCERLGIKAEPAFADFRQALANILDLVDTQEQARREREASGPSLTPQEISGLENAVTLVSGLAGVPIDADSAAAIGAAGRGTVGLFSRWRSGKRAPGGVGQQEIDIALDPERVLVSAFAAGMRTVCRKQNLVVAIDTAEIAEEALEALLKATGESGGGVVWLIAGRFDTPAESGYERSAVARFERSIGNDRITVIAISAFDRSLQGAYLQSRLGIAVEGADLEKLDQVTRGIPLALQLVVGMLREGLSLDELDRSVDAEGQSNTLIRGLTQRFLHHARSVRDGVPNPLQEDLPAIFGLVVDDTAEAGKIIGFDLQRRILAALLDVEPGGLRDRLDDLASRHDFVLAATGRVHQEVASVFREHLLDSDQRLSYAGMHERAVTVIRAEMAARYSAKSVGERLDDEAWRVLASALVRHEFWISNERGVRALVNVWPQAAVLHRPFARLLKDTARPFFATATKAEQQLLRGLSGGDSMLAGIRDWGPESRRLVDDPDAERAATQMIREVPRDVELGAPSGTRECLEELLAADRAAAQKSWEAVYARVASADAMADGEDEALSRAISKRALKAAGGLMFTSAGQRRSVEGHCAARIAARRDPTNGEARRLSAIGLREEGRFEEALVEHEGSMEATTKEPYLYESLGFTMLVLGRHDEARAAHEKACEMSPANVSFLVGASLSLRHMGAYEEAREKIDAALERAPQSGSAHYALARLHFDTGAYREGVAAADLAIEIEPSSAMNHGIRGLCLMHTGDRDRALSAFDSAIEKDPDFSGSYVDRGTLLAYEGRFEEAVSDLGKAVAIDRGEYESWGVLGILHRLGAEDEAASRDAFEALLRWAAPIGHPLPRVQFLAFAHAALGEPIRGIAMLQEVTTPPPAWAYQPDLLELARQASIPGVDEIERIIKESYGKPPARGSLGVG